MGLSSRRKGSAIERLIVALHQDAGLPAEKVSRTGYSGPDLRVADEFLAEVKARKTGEGFVLLETWLTGADLLFLKRNRQGPLVCMPWEVYERLLRGYLRGGTP